MLPAAAALFASVFNAPPWNDSWTSRSAERRLADLAATPGFFGVSATQNNDLVGFAIGHAEQWFTGVHFMVNEMCVRADLQRTGIGSSLLSALEQLVAEAEQFYLLTERGGAAHSFYERHGYRPTTRQTLLVKRAR